MKFVPFIIGILATAIVVYNNLRQLWEGTIIWYDSVAFMIVVFSTIGYYYYNKDKLRW